MKKLIIMRGCPGSGKSTLANQLLDKVNNDYITGKIHSTDEFHYEYSRGEHSAGPIERIYMFKPDKLHLFHKLNFQNAVNSMLERFDIVIIDNTNIKFEDFKSYVAAAFLLDYEVELREPESPWKYDSKLCFEKNTHGVPLASIERMLRRFETTESCLLKMKTLFEVLK